MWQVDCTHCKESYTVESMTCRCRACRSGIIDQTEIPMIMGTKAIDVECPKCLALAGVRCLGNTLCKERIALAVKITKDANAAARASRKT